MIEWCKKHTAFIRLIMHIPVGIVNFIGFLINGSIGFAFLTGFMIYELNEDWRLSDCAYKDILGWMFGFGGSILIFIGLKIAGIEIIF